MQFLSKQYPNGKYTVLDGGNGFVVLMESRPVALRKLRELGVTLPEKILDAKVVDSEWRAAFVSATAAEAVSTREAVEQAASEADVELVRRNQEKIETALASLAESVASINRESDIEKLRAFQESEYRRLVAAHGSEPNSEGQAMFRAHLASTAAGRRLAELEAG